MERDNGKRMKRKRETDRQTDTLTHIATLYRDIVCDLD